VLIRARWPDTTGCEFLCYRCSLFAGYCVLICARWPDLTVSELLSDRWSLFAGHRANSCPMARSDSEWVTLWSLLSLSRPTCAKSSPMPDPTVSEFLHDCFFLSFCKQPRANLFPIVRSDSECVSPSTLLFRCHLPSANPLPPRTHRQCVSFVIMLFFHMVYPFWLVIPPFYHSECFIIRCRMLVLPFLTTTKNAGLTALNNFVSMWVFPW